MYYKGGVVNFQDKLQWDIVDKCRESLKECGSATVQAGTGVGKTEMVKKILSTLKLDHSLIFIAPKINNVTDAHERYSEFGATLNIGSFGISEVSRVTCTTKQSIKKIDTSKFTIAIFDEFHRYSEEFIDSVDVKYKIFLSATPWNENGYIFDQFECVPKPCFIYGPLQAHKDGLLCWYEAFSSKHAMEVIKSSGRGDYTQKQIEKAIKSSKLCDQIRECIEIFNHYGIKKSIFLFSNIEHCEDGKREIEKYEECMIIHSKIKNNHKLIDEYKKNDTRCMSSVLVLSEGTNIPAVDCIVILRPCKSSRLFVQIIGRGLRKFPGKEKCLILDYANCFEACGLIENPIIPVPIGKKSESTESLIKQCENCFFIFEKTIHKSTCPKCGHINVQKKDVEKNLKKSLMEDEEIFHFDMDMNTPKKSGRGRNGQYMTIIPQPDLRYTVFGFQVKAVLSTLGKTGRCRVYFTKAGKYNFKYYRVEARILDIDI